MEQIEISYHSGKFVLTVESQKALVDAYRKYSYLEHREGTSLVAALLLHCKGNISKVEHYKAEYSYHDIRTGSCNMDSATILKTSYILHDLGNGSTLINDRVPAVREFDRNGNLARLWYYNEGKINSPYAWGKQVPAYQEFDEQGRLVRSIMAWGGMPRDEVESSPADKTFDPATGKVVGAVSYAFGQEPHSLSSDEIVALNSGNYRVNLNQVSKGQIRVLNQSH